MSEPLPGDLMRRRWTVGRPGLVFLLDARAMQDGGRRVSITVPTNSVGILVEQAPLISGRNDLTAIFLIGDLLVFDDLRMWDRVEEQCD